jgi:hypothetical protein
VPFRPLSDRSRIANSGSTLLFGSLRASHNPQAKLRRIRNEAV